MAPILCLLKNLDRRELECLCRQATNKIRFRTKKKQIGCWNTCSL